MKWNDNKRIFMFLVLNLFTILLFAHKRKTEAEWTIVTYMQVDNNLSPYAEHNINSMQKAGSTDQVNILIQWDQPANKKTWRYKIEKGGRVDVGSLNQEMGVNPEKELIACMRWAKENYPAKHYMLILSSHGGGVDDDRSKKWLNIPGLSLKAIDERGILYDDSQNTFLNNQGLAKAMVSIKKVLGKKLDILGMDACLMAMVEVAYQVKGSVDYLVASENTESCFGWDYAGFMLPLVAQPILFAPDMLAQSIVVAYSDFYNGANLDNQDLEFTLSAIDVNKITVLTSSLDAVIKQIGVCKKTNQAVVTNMITQVRQQALELFVSDYIDLDSFYVCFQDKIQEAIMNQKISEIKDKKEQIKAVKDSIDLKKLDALLVAARKVLDNAVLSSLSGPAYKDVQGISIYYPKSNIHPSYNKTAFARKSSWCTFLQNSKK